MAPEDASPTADSEPETVEGLKAALARLKADSAQALEGETKKRAELQIWLDQAESDAEELRTRLVEAEKRPLAVEAAVPVPKADVEELKNEIKRRSELQAWLDQSESEADELRGQLKEMENRLVAALRAAKAPAPAPVAEEPMKPTPPPAADASKKVDELQAWLQQAESESEDLRGQLKEMENRLVAALKSAKAPAPAPVAEEPKKPAAPPAADASKKVDELQAWLQHAEAESEELRGQLKEMENRLVAALKAAKAPAPAAEEPKKAAAVPAASSKKLDEAQTQLKQAKEEIEKLKGSVQESKDKEAALALAAKALEAAAVKAAETQKAAAASAQAKAQELEAAVTALKVDAIKAQKEQQKLTEQLAQSQAQIKALQEQVSRAPAPGEPEQVWAPAQPELPPLPSPEELAKEAVAVPMASLEADLQSNASMAKEAVARLTEDQRERAQLMEELAHLQTELGQLSNVKKELRDKLEAMVEREKRRQGNARQLLAKLREVEVVSAERINSLRRLQSTLERAQVVALSVQRVHFQRQIGSMQKKLEIAQGLRKVPKSRL